MEKFVTVPCLVLLFHGVIINFVLLDLHKWQQTLLQGPSRWSSSSSSATPSPSHTPTLTANPTPPHNTLSSVSDNTMAVEDVENDEELQMAIALSLSVADIDETSSNKQSNMTNDLNTEKDSNNTSSGTRSSLLLNLLHSTTRHASDV